MITLHDILSTYQGSDGDQTRAVFTELEQRGPAGIIALNLFRASKNSERAKLYRGGQRGKGSFKRKAYERKQWAMDNLARELGIHAEALDIRWGWRVDENQPFHRYVLYVDLPTGQASFHSAVRGKGPDYPDKWDGVRAATPQRICAYCAKLLEGAPA